jgi:hypothetical protein
MKFISRLAVTVFAVSMLAMPVPALAGDDDGEVEAEANGWYVRAGGQFTDLNDHGAWGYSVHAGRQISDYLAAEIGWLHVLDAEFASGKDDVMGVHVAGVLTYPMSILFKARNEGPLDLVLGGGLLFWEKADSGLGVLHDEVDFTATIGVQGRASDLLKARLTFDKVWGLDDGIRTVSLDSASLTFIYDF